MSIEITPKLLADLRQKAEAATPGEWLIGYGGMAGDDYAVIITRFWKNEICELNPRSYRRENAEFITACNPAVMLALVAEIERLRDRLDDLECPNCGNQPKFCMCEVEQPEASNADQA
jgi:hypothetical protein